MKRVLTMSSNKTDVFCIALILILVMYNIAIWFDFKNGNYDNLLSMVLILRLMIIWYRMLEVKVCFRWYWANIHD